MPTPTKYVHKDNKVRWRVRFRDGKRSASETFVTQREAAQFCKLVDAMGGARARAIMNETSADEVMTHTLGDVADRWLEWKSARRPDGSPKRVRAPYTLTRYEQLMRLHIRSGLGDRPINLVSEHDVQDWVDRLSDDLAPKTVHDAHAILHSIYKWANQRAQGLAVIDPCVDTDLPEKRRNIAKGTRPDEWPILHAAAVEVDQHAADLLEFFAATGERWSEAVAVRSLDIDDYGDDGLWVAMGRVLRRDGNTFTFVDNDAKSSAGIRRLKVVGSAAEMIRRRRVGLAPEDLLFTNGHGRPWIYAGFHSRYWTYSKLSTDGPNTKRRILQVAFDNGLKRAAVPGEITPHGLRHMHAVMLLLAGAPMAAVQKRMGHESFQTTMGTYGTMIGDVDDDVLTSVDEILAGRQALSGLSRSSAQIETVAAEIAGDEAG